MLYRPWTKESKEQACGAGDQAGPEVKRARKRPAQHAAAQALKMAREGVRPVVGYPRKIITGVPSSTLL